jgi:hypothetical protein
MKNEHPLLYQADMVRALLDGTKTQTRRIIKPQPGNVNFKEQPQLDEVGGWVVPGRSYRWTDDDATGRVWKPLGKPGDRIWVKETHQIYGHWIQNGVSITGRQKWIFVAHHSLKVKYQGDFEPHPKSRDQLGWWTHPSIFMCRWASRITLELTAVRAERLQDISDADALSEGINRISGVTGADYGYRDYRLPAKTVCVYRFQMPFNSYMSLWESINGPDSWSSNPMVWVYTFRKL